MVFARATQILLLIAALVASPAFASRVRRASTNNRHHHATARRHHTRYVRHYQAVRTRQERSVRRGRYVRRVRYARRDSAVRGQRSINPARVTQIQQALIKAKYLSGPPSGQWDAETISAMKKYQSDHGWQTRLMPDSRALIALGLGPEQDHVPPSGGTVDAAQVLDPQPNTLASVHTISQ